MLNLKMNNLQKLLLSYYRIKDMMEEKLKFHFMTQDYMQIKFIDLFLCILKITFQ